MVAKVARFTDQSPYIVDSTLDVGESFGQYTVLATLTANRGAGKATGPSDAMIAQWAAEAGFARLVVIKTLFPDGQEKKFSPYLDSTKKAAGLHHPNVRQIYEIGTAEGSVYLAIEYLEGITFDTLLRTRARAAALSDPRMYCALLAQACEGIHHAHTRLRLLHGALRPDKLFVTSGGTIKLLGLGLGELANATAAPSALADAARYAYVSPEQILGRSTDERADVFSLGIMAWEALTGRRLFARSSRVEVYRAITEKPIPSPRTLAPSIPQALDRSVSRALSTDPAARFKTAREFGLALEEGVSELGAPLSTVAIASLIDRCFAQELESQRATVQRARQRLSTPEGEEDQFDVPTRLYEGGFGEAQATSEISPEALANLLASGTEPNLAAYARPGEASIAAEPVAEEQVVGEEIEIEVDVEERAPPAASISDVFATPLAVPETPAGREFERPPETLSDVSSSSAIDAALATDFEPLGAPPATGLKPAPSGVEETPKIRRRGGRLIVFAAAIFLLAAASAFAYRQLTSEPEAQPRSRSSRISAHDEQTRFLEPTGSEKTAKANLVAAGLGANLFPRQVAIDFALD